MKIPIGQLMLNLDVTKPPYTGQKDPKEVGILTGSMGDCVCAILLYGIVMGMKPSWKSMRGQHGGGGHRKLDFTILFKGIERAMLNRLVIVGREITDACISDVREELRKIGQAPMLVDFHVSTNVLVRSDATYTKWGPDVNQKLYDIRDLPDASWRF